VQSRPRAAVCGIGDDSHRVLSHQAYHAYACGTERSVDDTLTSRSSLDTAEDRNGGADQASALLASASSYSKEAELSRGRFHEQNDKDRTQHGNAFHCPIFEMSLTYHSNDHASPLTASLLTGSALARSHHGQQSNVFRPRQAAFCNLAC
jgi:hypothetical protein